MFRSILLGGCALIIGAQAAQAQDGSARPAPEASPAPAGGAAQQGVLVFPPDFFAGSRPNSALDMVNRIPGFSIDDGDGGRGFEGAVGNVLINGARPASKNDAGSSVLNRTAASQVERIELIRGGAPGVDMQGYAVVANVILKRESSRQTVVQWNASLFEGGQDLFGGMIQLTGREGERAWGLTLSDNVSQSDSNGAGSVLRHDGAGVLQRAEDYYNDGYGGGTSLRANYAAPLFGGRVDLTGRYGVNDWHGVNIQTAPGLRRDSRNDNDGGSGEFGVVYTRPLSPRLALETRFIHQFNDFDSVSVSNTRSGGVDSPEQRFTSVGDASETILRGQFRFDRSQALAFELGGEVAYNRLDTEQAFTVGGTPVTLPSASVTVEETRGELFGKATWRMRPDLTLESGLRIERSVLSQSGDADQEKSFVFAKPRVLLTWTPGSGHQLRLRLEREVGQLDFDDFAASAELSNETVFGGNVHLEPEQRWIGEITYERRFWGEGVVSIGLRHDAISDALDRLPLDSGLSAYGNIGDATLDQLNLNIRLPLDRIGFSGGKFGFRNSWNRTEVTDPTTGEARPLSGVRPRQAVISLEQDIAAWRIRWGGAWIPRLGQTSFDPDQVSGWRGADYFEFWAEYKPTDTLTVRAQVNLWDDFVHERTVFADRSAARPVAFVETRDIDPRTFWQIRVRKSF